VKGTNDTANTRVILPHCSVRLEQDELVVRVEVGMHSCTVRKSSGASGRIYRDAA
jgi:hypothetical protein